MWKATQLHHSLWPLGASVMELCRMGLVPSDLERWTQTLYITGLPEQSVTRVTSPTLPAWAGSVGEGAQLPAAVGKSRRGVGAE